MPGSFFLRDTFYSTGGWSPIGSSGISTTAATVNAVASSPGAYSVSTDASPVRSFMASYAETSPGCCTSSKSPLYFLGGVAVGLDLGWDCDRDLGCRLGVRALDPDRFASLVFWAARVDHKPLSNGVCGSPSPTPPLDIFLPLFNLYTCNIMPGLLWQSVLPTYAIFKLVSS